MSEQKTEPSLDRPRDGSSTRHSSNWLGLWADDINSTLSPQPVAAAGCFLAGRRQRGARLWYRAAGYYGHAIVCPPNQRAPASGTARAGSFEPGCGTPFTRNWPRRWSTKSMHMSGNRGATFLRSARFP